tara:strand:- start:40 stop:642 length:603 start_codon:yes stop_codon:yes gene_type:complete
MNKNIVLIGLGGNTYDIYEALEFNNYSVIGYVDINRKEKVEELISINYLGNDETFKNLNNLETIITFSGIGKGISLRKKIFTHYQDSCISFIFPKTTISKFANISSRGVLIFGNCTVKAYSEIHDNVFINSGTIIGHHCILRKNTVISIGVKIGGNVDIGEEVFIGMGAMVFQNVNVGKGAIIGAGAVVRKDVPPNGRIF